MKLTHKKREARDFLASFLGRFFGRETATLTNEERREVCSLLEEKVSTQGIGRVARTMLKQISPS